MKKSAATGDDLLSITHTNIILIEISQLLMKTT